MSRANAAAVLNAISRRGWVNYLQDVDAGNVGVMARLNNLNIPADLVRTAGLMPMLFGLVAFIQGRFVDEDIDRSPEQVLFLTRALARQQIGRENTLDDKVELGDMIAILIRAGQNNGTLQSQ